MKKLLPLPYLLIPFLNLFAQEPSKTKSFTISRGASITWMAKMMHGHLCFLIISCLNLTRVPMKNMPNRYKTV
jgi:hypothetical protein